MKSCFATVCFHGKKTISKKGNEKREADFIEVMSKINQLTSQPQAIIFPGGFFYLSQHIGHLSFEDRKQVIEASSIGEVCQKGLAVLNTPLPGPLLVVGIDSPKKARQGCSADNGDQLCVAFDNTGVVGIGRKIFPDDYELFDYVAYAGDFREPTRVVQLPDGRKAVLCACYDMFGIAESPEHTTKRTKNIKYVGEGDRLVADTDEPGHAEVRDGLVREWADMLKRENVSVGLAAIHQFDLPGRDLYWQRHGVAVASATLNGGLALGAAHFVERLPEANKSTLAAEGVPQSHLADGLNRKHHAMKPIESLHVDTPHGSALIRVFAS